ncbi:MAG: outer membrane protein [Verrucomicrobiales bacterium]
MKNRFLLPLAALLAAGSFAQADLQLNAGGIYARGSEEDSFGFELGAGFYFKHTTSAFSSSLTLNYLDISTIDEESGDSNVEAGYDVVALDYRVAFPIAGDALDFYIEGLAGVANTDASASIDDFDYNAAEWGFAYGFGGGLQWNITQNFGLNLGYTFLGLDAASDNGVAIGEDSLNLIRLNASFRF